jgi:hypothetical protein
VLELFGAVTIASKVNVPFHGLVGDGFNVPPTLKVKI